MTLDMDGKGWDSILTYFGNLKSPTAAPAIYSESGVWTQLCTLSGSALKLHLYPDLPQITFKWNGCCKHLA